MGIPTDKSLPSIQRWEFDKGAPGLFKNTSGAWVKYGDHVKLMQAGAVSAPNEILNVDPEVWLAMTPQQRADARNESAQRQADQATALNKQGGILAKTYEEADGPDEATRLRELINTPELDNFLRAVHVEALHQVERWGTAHDRAKRPADWFWLTGCLAGKALHSAVSGNTEKALHHCISTAAALYNWHCAIKGVDVSMCPGRSDFAELVEREFPGSSEAAS